MRIFKFSCRLSRRIESDFFIISLEKTYAKTTVETSRPDISSASYIKLLTYQPTSASVQRSFSMLKSMIHENRNFTDASRTWSHSTMKLHSTVEYFTCCKVHI